MELTYRIADALNVRTYQMNPVTITISNVAKISLEKGLWEADNTRT